MTIQGERASSIYPADEEQTVGEAGFVAVAAGLGAVAATVVISRNSADIPDINGAPGFVYDSLAHPFLGYAGAYALTKLNKMKGSLRRMFIGGAVANFGAEYVQDKLVTYDFQPSFYEQPYVPETIKDYAFSLAGTVLFFGHWKLKNRNQHR